MDIQWQTTRLDADPEDVTFDTSHGTITVPAEPFGGPGIYTIQLTLLNGPNDG